MQIAPVTRTIAPPDLVIFNQAVFMPSSCSTEERNVVGGDRIKYIKERARVYAYDAHLA